MNIGTKYNATMTIKEIARAVRADLAAASKAGVLPAGVRVSVRADSGALRVRVTKTPFQILSCEYLEGAVSGGVGRYTQLANAVLETVTALVQAYNYDNSDTMTDYFNVRFYDGVASFDYLLESAERAQWNEYKKELPLPEFTQ